MTAETAKRSELTDRPNKRRAGAGAGGLSVAESRPQIVDGKLIGARCVACEHALSQVDVPWCPVCFSDVERCEFTPRGTVWAATTMRIPVGVWRAPFALGYVDILDGPRVLVHVSHAPPPSVGEVIDIVGTDNGDLAQSGLEGVQ